MSPAPGFNVVADEHLQNGTFYSVKTNPSVLCGRKLTGSEWSRIVWQICAVVSCYLSADKCTDNRIMSPD